MAKNAKWTVMVLMGANNIPGHEGALKRFANADLKEMQAGGAKKAVGEMLEFQRNVRNIMVAMRRCPQPVISIVNGSASGGGFALALASDIRLATPDARLLELTILTG